MGAKNLFGVFKWNVTHIIYLQSGTLAGNITIKKLHNEFPSDVFLTMEALNVNVIVGLSATNQQTMSISEYLRDKTKKTVIIAFELPAYPKEKFIFKSYKVKVGLQLLTRSHNL